MAQTEYFKKQENSLNEYEALCKHCGKCCGADTTSPCSNLEKDRSGRYYCRIYENRLGQQFTISGMPFTCVEIRDVLSKGLPNDECGYIQRGR